MFIFLGRCGFLQIIFEDQRSQRVLMFSQIILLMNYCQAVVTGLTNMTRSTFKKMYKLYSYLLINFYLQIHNLTISI